MKRALGDALRTIGKHPLATAAVVLGFAAVIAISFLTHSVTAMLWGGMVVGVLVGAAIAAASRSADQSARKGRRKRRR